MVKKRLVPLEAEEQMALMQWVALQPLVRDFVISIPNEGVRTPRMGRKLKMMGLSVGASDLFMAIPRSSHHGLFLELKRREGSKTTAAQEAFQERMRGNGYRAEICFGWEEAKRVIEEYLRG